MQKKFLHLHSVGAFYAFGLSLLQWVWELGLVLSARFPQNQSAHKTNTPKQEKCIQSSKMIVCPKVLSVVMNSQNDRHNDANKGGISARCRLKRAQTPIYTTLLPYEAIKLCDLEDRLEQQPFLMKLRRVWFCYVREGKDYLVVHDVSAVITLFFFLIFTLFFLFSSLLSLSTRYSDCLNNRVSI